MARKRQRKQKTNLAGKLILGFVFAIVIFSALSFFGMLGHLTTVPSGPALVQNDSVQSRYQDHMSVIKDDSDRLDAISARYPTKMTDHQYIFFANEYALQLQNYSQHLSEFRQFVIENEPRLNELGYNTTEKKAAIEADLAWISQSASAMYKNLKVIEQREQVNDSLFTLLSELAAYV